MSKLRQLLLRHVQVARVGDGVAAQATQTTHARTDLILTLRKQREVGSQTVDFAMTVAGIWCAGRGFANRCAAAGAPFQKRPPERDHAYTDAATVARASLFAHIRILSSRVREEWRFVTSLMLSEANEVTDSHCGAGPFMKPSNAAHVATPSA
jgi:hypothetical protein